MDQDGEETTWREAKKEELQRSLQGDEGGYRKKKPRSKMTKAERKQEMKGLSKAFISSGSGWNKVDPVHVIDDEEEPVAFSGSSETNRKETSSNSNNQKATYRQKATPLESKERDDPTTLDSGDVLALMRTQTQKLRQKNRNGEPLGSKNREKSKGELSLHARHLEQLSQIQRQPDDDRNMPAPTLTSLSLPSSGRDNHRNPHLQQLAQIPRQVEPEPPTVDSSGPSPQEARKNTQDVANSEVQNALHRLLQMAEAEGPEAALRWAKTQVKRPETDISSYQTATASARSAAPPIPRPLRKHQATASISWNDGSDRSQKMAVEIERQHHGLFREAIQTIPPEFGGVNDNIRWIVRRPYGCELNPKLFEQVGGKPSAQYNRQAHVSTLSTLEVVVAVGREDEDMSPWVVLLLAGSESIRYRQDTDSEWQTGNVFGTSSLGQCQINTSTNKGRGKDARTLSLDDLAQQSIWVRDQYASSVTNLALGLLERRPNLTISRPKVLPVKVLEPTPLDIERSSNWKSSETNSLLSPQPSSPKRHWTASLYHFRWWFTTRLLPPSRRRILAVLLATTLTSFFVYQVALQIHANEAADLRTIQLPRQLSQWIMETSPE